MQLLLLFWLIIPVRATEPVYLTLPQSEIRLQNLFALLSQHPAYKEKSLIADTINAFLDSALHLPGSFDYPFDLLRSLGKITSADQKLRIYTWNSPLSGGNNKYYGFIQYKTGQKEEIKLYRLTDNRSNITYPAHAVLNVDNWYGALYYEIVEIRIEGVACYTMLGFNPEDFFTSQKIIDILWFNEQYEPAFGKPVFRFQKQYQSRILFTYSAKAIMSLTWNNDLKMIVYDHLSPIKPSYTGNYQFYGPDFSYDGLRFEKGIWESVENINVRNSKE